MPRLWIVCFPAGLLLSSLLGAQSPDLERCSTPSEIIGPDSPIVDDTITITDSQVIADLQVRVDITHTFVGDLTLVLAHEGTAIGLHDGSGGGAEDILVTFNDAGAPYGTEPFDCECAIAPSGPGSLSDFDGGDTAGDWVLTINDAFPDSDDGVLSQWCVLSYETVPPPPPAPVTNLLCISAPGSGFAQIAWTNPQIYDQILVFIDGVLVDALPGFAPGYVTPPQSVPSIIEVCVRGVVDGVLSPRRCCQVPLEQVVDLVLCDEPDYLITDVLPVLAVIDVEEDLNVGDLQVWVDITHTFIGDLLVDLSSPARTTVRLHDGEGFSADDLRLTYWEFGVPNGEQPYDCECMMQPSGPGALTDFVGESTQGLWRIFVIDQFLGDFGMFHEWCLRIFENEPVFPVADLACEVGAVPGTAVVTWTNPRDYDAISIFVNSELEAILPGPFAEGWKGSSVTDALQSPDDLQICVVPSRSGDDGPQQCCSVDVTLLPIQDLQVNLPGGTGVAEFSWSSLVPYDRINIYHDGVLVFVLPGDVTSHITNPLAFPTTAEYCFEAVLDSFGVAPRVCLDVLLLGPAEIEACSSPGTPITDLSSFVDSVTIADDDLILDLEVNINITHTFVGDLDLDLSSPSGTSVRLHDQGGASANDLFLVYSDAGVPSGSQPFDCGCAMQVSGLDSVGRLEDFFFESPLGEWTLVVTDNILQDQGTLNYWCLRIPDSCELMPVQDLACEVTGGEVLLNWTNPATYSGLAVERDGAAIAVLPGAATSYLDTEVEPGVYRYQIVASATGIACDAPSLPCEAAFGITDLIFAAEQPGLVDSAGALAAELIANGRVVQSIRTFDPSTTSPPESEIQAIWVVLGTFPANHPLTESEGFLLAELHTGDLGLDGEFDQDPIPVYLEGGDIWGFDAPTAFIDYDGIENGPIDDGDDSLFELFGEDTFLGLDFSDGSWDAFYQQDQLGDDFTDRLFPATVVPDLGGPAASVLWTGGSLEPEYNIGIFYFSIFAPVISQSFEFGGYLGDQTALSTVYRQALQGELTPVGGDDFKRGDWDADGLVLINDPIYCLSFIFQDGPGPPCPDAGDANDNGSLGIADAIYILGYLFDSTSPPPPAPGPTTCGQDFTPDPLGSCVYSACN